MRWSNLTLFVCITCFVLTAACSGKSSAELKTLTPYAKATLTPGTGLGDIQLGKTTLGWLAQNIGKGRPSVIASDESAIELTFLEGEISFLFIVAGACQTETGAPQKRIEVGQDIQAFLARYPGCNELPLSSLSVATRRNNQSATFFQGSTDRGVQLWAPVVSAYQHGIPLNNAGVLVAGEGYTGENLDRIEFPNGIYFYYPTGEGPTAEEIRSGRPLSPERLREIEASAKQAASNASIQRITIFMPNVSSSSN